MRPQAIVSSHLSSPSNNPNLKNLSLSTASIFWFGVPHRGAESSVLTVGQVLLNIVGAVRQTSQKAVNFMEPNNEALKGLFENFNRISGHFKQRAFYEAYKTPVKMLGGVKKIQVRYRASFHVSYTNT
jgi:hypothetical protein